MLYSFTYSIILLQSVPGVGAIEDGIKAASNSVNLEINKILSAIILAICLLSFCVIKYLIKEKDKAVKAVREDMAKEQAINEGAHQTIIKAKDDHIFYLTTENENLKEKYTDLIKDNTEGFKQVAIKVGSFVEGQAVVAANQERYKSETLLEINKLFTLYFKK